MKSIHAMNFTFSDTNIVLVKIYNLSIIWYWFRITVDKYFIIIRNVSGYSTSSIPTMYMLVRHTAVVYLLG